MAYQWVSLKNYQGNWYSIICHLMLGVSGHSLLNGELGTAEAYQYNGKTTHQIIYLHQTNQKKKKSRETQLRKRTIGLS